MGIESWIEMAVLMLLPWPAVRFLSIPSIRREFPRIAALIAGSLLIYALGVAWVVAYSPSLLRAASTIAAGALILERWRARGSFGIRRGLPPGSLTLFPRGPWVDHLFYRRLHNRLGPIFKTSLLHRPMICLHGAQVGMELMREHETNLETIPVRFNRFIPRGFLRYMAPDDHGKYRHLLRSAISPDILEANESRLAETTHDMLLEMAASRETNPALRIDPRAELRELCFRALARLFLDLPAESADYRRLNSLYDSIDLRKVSLIPSDRDRKALDEASALIRSLSGRIDTHPVDSAGTPRCVLEKLLRLDSRSIDDDTLLGNLIYVVHIGRADLTSLGIWILKMLGDHPQWWSRLKVSVETGDTDGTRALASRIVKETLRLEQSEYLYRRAANEIRFRGLVIPAGWRVRVLIREGHRDPRLFDEPEAFNPDRFLHQGATTGRYAPFGLGAHSCIGPHVTDTVMRTLLVELARGFDWRVVRDGPREYGWAHWQPSSRFRIEIAKSSAEPPV